MEEKEIEASTYELYISLLSSSLQSYKRTSLLKPIPQRYQKEEEEDYESFLKDFEKFPNYKEIFENIKESIYLKIIKKKKKSEK
jgi:hypothetical protein